MLSALAGPSLANDDLATAAQNPVADMVSLPFQNNTYFGVGPDEDTANVLSIQPVMPFALGDWNLITRTIVPIVYLPSVADSLPNSTDDIDRGDKFGLGDINLTAFLSPADSGSLTWDVGPSLTAASATSDRLGSEKWSAGPSAVALSIDPPWVYGALVRQLWSFTGSDDRNSVNQFLAQPFVNYNLPEGWYLVGSPIITANWDADSSERWSVPVGGGAGRVFKIGEQAVNLQAQSFYNVESPENGADWSLRLQFTFLFPR